MATFQEFLRLAQISIEDKTSHKRTSEIRHIMHQYHVLSGMTPEKAVQILEALGPTYIKIGQLASNRSDLLPKAYCDAFEKLRDDATPLPFDEVIKQIDEAYQTSWHTVFESIEPVPLGSASIAQVHKATLLDGTVVAVKVRRPQVAESMAEDITLMKHLLATGEFLTTTHRNILDTLRGFVDEIARTTESEVDFTIELNNLVRFRKELEAQKGVTCPRAYPEYSTDAVLVMEYVEGVEVTNFEGLEAQGVKRKELANRICQSYVEQVLDKGFFHADPHPGNILVRDGVVVWIDLGMVGTLTVSERGLVGKMFTAVATNNAYLLKEAVMGLTTVTGPIDHGALLDALSRLLTKYGTAEMHEINVGVVFSEVIEILRNQNLKMVSSVTMLARGFMTLEGVIATLSPSTSVVDIISKHVMEQAVDAHHIVEKALRFLMNSTDSLEQAAKLPSQMSNTLLMLERGQLKMNGTVDVSNRVLETLYAAVGRLALALLSAGLFLGSAILCTTNLQPQVLGAPLLGVIGFVSAFVLGAYTVWRIMVSHHRMINHEKPR
jgi:ubiquinone biosynthesis protein